MATTQVTPENTQQLTSEVQSTPTVQQTNRETVQEKYSRLYEPSTSAETVQTPLVPPPSTPPDPNVLLMQELQSLRNELALVKTAVTPIPTPSPVVELTPWFEQLRQGKFEEAEADLKRRITEEIRSSIVSETTQKANENLRVQVEMDRFLNELRGANPDLVPMESYLTAPVELRIQQAQAAKQINSPDDFLRVYKTVVKEEADKLREITLKYRAQGANSASTRQQDVRSAMTLPPQQVSSTQNETPETFTPEPIQDYFTRRKAGEARARGM